jgi:hypothetical protein
MSADDANAVAAAVEIESMLGELPAGVGLTMRAMLDVLYGDQAPDDEQLRAFSSGVALLCERGAIATRGAGASQRYALTRKVQP